APDPSFPGCVYSEMKMCLAPCFKGCTDEEYAGEIGRVEAYLNSGGRSLRRAWEEQREAASSAMEFEEASGLHVRLEKLVPVERLLPDFARPIAALNGVVLQTSSEAGAIALFRVAGGMISGPKAFAIEAAHSGKPSMESRLAEAVSAIG